MLRALDQGIVLPNGQLAPPGADLSVVCGFVEGDLWRPILAKRTALRNLAMLLLGGAAAAGFLVTWTVSGAAGLLLSLVLILGAAGVFVRAQRLVPVERVTGAGRAYCAAVALPLEGGAACYDMSGTVPETRISVPVISESSSLPRLLSRLRALADGGTVLEPLEDRQMFGASTLFGGEAEVGRALLELLTCLRSRTAREVKVRALSGRGDFVASLDAISKLLTNSDFGPVITVTDASTLAETNRELEGIHAETRAVMDLDEVLRLVTAQLHTTRDRMATLHQISGGVLTDLEVLATYTSAWPAIAYYCRACAVASSPDMTQPQLSEAFRVQIDAASGKFRCPLCGRAVDADSGVIFLNRFDREVFQPLFDQILASMHESIAVIDRDVENQMMQLEKEEGVKFQETSLRVEQEHRKRLAQVRQHRVHAISLKAQVDGTAATLQQYRKLSAERAAAFQRDAESINAQIEKRIDNLIAKAEKEHTEHQLAARVESDRRADINREENERRHREVVEQLQEVTAGVRETAATMQRSAETAEKSLKYQMMTDEERETLKPSAFANPLKSYSRWAARKHVENRASRL